VKLPIEFSAEAEEELEAAVVWFDEQRSGLGSDFMEAIDDAIGLISEWPRSGSIVVDVPEDLEVRRAPISRFRFHLGFLMLRDRVRVLAVAHDHRKPGYWLPRAQD
jgi:plasmid stabilization system protein ParE